MVVNSPASPKVPSLGLPVSYPKQLLTLVVPRHSARLHRATILYTPLSHSHALVSFFGQCHRPLCYQSPTDTVFP